MGLVTGEMERDALEAMGISGRDIERAVTELSAMGIDGLRRSLDASAAPPARWGGGQPPG